MGNTKPTNPKKFQKGNCANPRGAGAHNKEVKVIRRLTHDDIAEIGSLILDGNVEKLKEIQTNPATTVLKVWMCSVAIKAINKGDAQALNALLDRIVGKPKESLNLVSTVISANTEINLNQFLEFKKQFKDEY